MVTIDWNTPSLAPLAAAAVECHPAGSPGATCGASFPPEVGRATEPVHDQDLLLESWFERYFSPLWRLVARLGLPSPVVDDVVQDAFIAASRRHADILAGREWSFLVGTALRLSANYRLRASTRREVAESDLLESRASPWPDAEELLIEKRSRQELEQALATLSSAHRAVFVLYELEGFSAPEIAELLSLPLGTVASRLGRARLKFSEIAARMQRARLDRREDP
jgi:RNA polymerase sigma-70 factor, ECF subfamily